MNNLSPDIYQQLLFSLLAACAVLVIVVASTSIIFCIYWLFTHLSHKKVTTVLPQFRLQVAKLPAPKLKV